MIFNKNIKIRNLLCLISSTTIAQIISVIVSPILTRLYSPEIFGEYSLYLSIYSILIILFTAGYESAINLPKREATAHKLIILCIIISIGCCITSEIIIFINNIFFHKNIINLSENYIILLPFAALVGSIYKVMHFYYIRVSWFNVLSKINILQALFLAILNVVFAYIIFNYNGLIISNFLALFSITIITFIIFKNRTSGNSLKIKKILFLSKRYENFPKFSLTSNLFNIAVTSIPIMLFSNFYGTYYLGMYAIASRCINMPLSVIGSSISQIFLNDIAKIKSNKVMLKEITEKYYNYLLYLNLLFPIIGLLAEPLFGFIFGEKWIFSGKIVKILSPYLSVAFIYSSLSSLITIKEVQSLSLKFNMANFFTNIVIIFIFHFNNISFINLITCMSLFNFILWNVFGYFLLNLVNIKFKKFLKNLVIYTIIPFLFCNIMNFVWR